MPPRICTSCDEPHITTDWYVINDRGHKQRGDVECREAHEDRVRRETRDMVRYSPDHKGVSE